MQPKTTSLELAGKADPQESILRCFMRVAGLIDEAEQMQARAPLTGPEQHIVDGYLMEAAKLMANYEPSARSNAE